MINIKFYYELQVLLDYFFINHDITITELTFYYFFIIG
jgi:hypothetical protein